MPPAAKAPKKPQAPKKPSSRSKTGNDACSKAASNWQLAIRGKEPLDPETYKTLGKCRALARSKKQASDFGRTGKLSEQGQKALEGRLQKRFDQGKITQKSRAEELKILLAKRAERAKARAASGQQKPAETEKTSVFDTREQSNQAQLENKYRLKKPIEGKDGSRLVGYQWVSTTEEGMFRDRKVSDWGAAQTSVPTGRSIVHLFWVSDKSGKETLMGRGAAENALGWNKNKLLTTAKHEHSRQQEQQRRNAAEVKHLETALKPSKKEALHSFYDRTPTHFRGGKDPLPVYLTEKNGGYIATYKNNADLLVEAGGKSYRMAFGRGTPSRTKQAENLLALRKQKQEQASQPKETVARLAPTASGKAVLRPAREPKPGLTDTKRLIGQVKAKEKARAETQSGVRTVKTSELKADPERFQYKLNTNATGVTDQFKETKVWNKELAGVVQVWKDPANGQTYVVNGHHRYELASRLGVKNLNVQYIQAASAAEARQKGALTNIAEGRGTSLDAGKFLRDLKTDNPEAIFQQRGISLSEKTASEGLALRNLASPIWSKVINEQTPLSRAVAIGKSKLREEDQIQLFNKAEKGQWTSGKTLEFGKELKRAPLVKTQTDNLFGDEEFINVAEQRAALADRFQTRMKTDANLFGKVGRSRNAGRLEQVGSNRIDVTSSQEQAKQAQNAVDMFNIERNYGLVSRTLDKYATGIAGGQKLDKVYPQFERQVSKQLDNILNKEIRDKRAAELRAMNPADRRKLAKRRTARV